MKHSKGMNKANHSGAIDDGRNETTKTPYTDFASVPASEETLKKHKKNKRK